MESHFLFLRLEKDTHFNFNMMESIPPFTKHQSHDNTSAISIISSPKLGILKNIAAPTNNNHNNI